jgi:hypothetical protein
MVDVLLSTDSLSVLGGPDKIELEVDYGSKGDRGSRFYTGNGEPGAPGTPGSQVPADTAVYDMYINKYSTNGYLDLYQFLTVSNTKQWVRVGSLLPNTYIDINSAVFVDGIAEIGVSLLNISHGESIDLFDPSNMSVQYSVLNTDNALATSISIADQFVPNEADDMILVLTIKAYEFNGTTWTALNGEYPVHLFISGGII